MKELLQTRRITIAVIVFIVILGVGLATMQKPMHEFKLTPELMADEITMIYQVTPDEAMEFMYDSAYVFVDLRSIYDFEKGHLENAVSIPIPNLLKEESKDKLVSWKEDSTTVVLYGNTELEANSAWILLYELGYDNTRVLMGGMGYLDKLYDGTLNENESFSVEDPVFDYAGIVKAASMKQNTPVVEESKPVKKKVIVRKKKKKAAEGGC